MMNTNCHNMNDLYRLYVLIEVKCIYHKNYGFVHTNLSTQYSYFSYKIKWLAFKYLIIFFEELKIKIMFIYNIIHWR